MSKSRRFFRVKNFGATLDINEVSLTVQYLFLSRTPPFHSNSFEYCHVEVLKEKIEDDARTCERASGIVGQL